MLCPKKGHSLRSNQCRTDAVSKEGTFAEKQSVQKCSRNRGCPTLVRRGSSRRDVPEVMSPQPVDVPRSSSQRCSSSRLVGTLGVRSRWHSGEVQSKRRTLHCQQSVRRYCHHWCHSPVAVQYHHRAPSRADVTRM